MQNLDERMYKIGKWFMILGIAGFLTLYFVEWSRWNLVPLSMEFKTEILKTEVYEIKTEFVEGVIATVSIFFLFAAPSLIRWDNRSAQNVTLLFLSVFIDISGILSVIVRGEISVSYIMVILLSMIVYVKSIMEILRKLYHWIKIGTNENSFDIAKMTFIWAIIAFILGKIW